MWCVNIVSIRARDLALLVLLVFLRHSASGQYELADEYISDTSDSSDPNSDEKLYEKARLGEYNYVVFVTSKAGICTGTIVNPDWILTAAHCLIFRDAPIFDKEAMVIVGITDYRFTENTKKAYHSVEVHVHPDFWDMHLGKFDVALVKLKDSLEFGSNIGNITLAGDEWPQADEGVMQCLALGFGSFYSTAPETTYLKAWNVTAEHNITACPCVKGFQYKRMVCVHEKTHSLMCKGDDGGPLVCKGVVRAIGHMIYSESCDNINYPSYKCYGDPATHAITTYTLLCPMLDWLHSIVDDIPRSPPSCRATTSVLPAATVLPLVLIALYHL